MTAVSVVWMLSLTVLYTPYLDVICKWDIPPILAQKWAELVVFMAEISIQVAGVWFERDFGTVRRAGEMS